MAERDTGGFVTTERTGPDEVVIVIVTAEGVTGYPCPGGLTEEDLLD